ncbi:MAG: DUF4339 domain-containing protein [Chthoniobacter sp.]|uniref:DUF4339 domain-containing protein n=1 Tax=Chthoniobacter sp. TaxID=2510640 RepID=UPI0032A20BF7
MISPEIFYLHIHGEQRGPYTIPQIDHLLNSGLIAEETLYWREGLEQWQPVTTLVKLRKRANPWLRRIIIFGFVLLIGFVVQFFGSVALLGWREANQHEYTASSAYWRARGIVRGGALAPGAVVDFGDFAGSSVELQPPDGATVHLHGEITEPTGQVRKMTWTVPLQYDAKAREWNGGPPQEVAP